VQPDRGALCAYWLEALISCLLDKGKRSCLEFQVYALRALEATIFVHTGHAVPRPLRLPLVTATHEMLKGGLLDKSDLLSAVAVTALQTLSWLLLGDDAFAEYVRFATLLCMRCISVSCPAQPRRICGVTALSKLLRVVAAALRCSIRKHVRPAAAHIAADFQWQAAWRVQAGGTRIVADAMEAADGHKRRRFDCCARDIACALGPWHLEGMCAMVAHDGLAASAYGTLACPQAVEALVARWTAAPWAGRLKPAWDYLIVFQTGEPTGVSGVGAEAQERARRRVGRLKPHAPPIVEVSTEDGLQHLAEAMRALQPHAAGGGRAALVLLLVRLPRGASMAEARVFGRNSAMSDAQKAEVRGIVGRPLQSVGPATAKVGTGWQRQLRWRRCADDVGAVRGRSGVRGGRKGCGCSRRCVYMARRQARSSRLTTRPRE
jgi:hypothetical protein